VGGRQSIHSMGLVQGEVCILAQRATTKVRAFLFTNLIATYVLIIHSI
jgi:hypothetical protein